MNNIEFRDQFDLEFNNIMSNQAPDLDNYEISRFLTQAQEQLVIQLYNGTGISEGFESKELYRKYLDELIINKSVDMQNPLRNPINKFNRFWEWNEPIDSEVLVVISERMALIDECGNKVVVNVVPTKYDEFNKVMNNPFRWPNNIRALRVDTKGNIAKLYTHVGNPDVLAYEYDYLKKPYPIILEDLSNYGQGLTIDNQDKPYGYSLGNNEVCELDSSLHRTIITLAAQLAAQAWADKK